MPTTYIKAPGQNFLGERDGWVPSIAEDRWRGEVTAKPEDVLKAQELAAKAEIRARKQRGWDKYERGIANGLKPEEAFRLAAPDLLYDKPDEVASALRTLTPKLPSEIPKEMGGVPFYDADRKVIGHGVFDPSSGGLQSFVPVRPDSMPVATREELKDVNSEAAFVRRQLLDAQKLAMSGRASEREAAQKQIPGLEAALAGLTQRKQSIFNPKPSTPEPEKKQPDSSTEKVIVIKDGKKFRLPKSQLKEAEAQGYKLAN